MDASELFRTYLTGKDVALTADQFAHWVSLFSARNVKKHDFLLREGDVAKHTFFTVHGCLRIYTVDSKGKEHIMQFAPDNWWIGDMESSLTKKPSEYFIDALEDSELLVIKNEDLEAAMKSIPGLALLFQRLMQNRQTATQKRIIFSMSATAEERYLDFIKTYRDLAQRIPQHMIASYLGITPESLSRIRANVVKKTPAHGAHE